MCFEWDILSEVVSHTPQHSVLWASKAIKFTKNVTTNNRNFCAHVLLLTFVSFDLSQDILTENKLRHQYKAQIQLLPSINYLARIQNVNNENAV